MKWKIVPVLGAVCVVLLAGCCRMTDGGVPAVALNRDTKEEKTVTEPSDPKAPSMDKAETERRNVRERQYRSGNRGKHSG